MQRVVLLNHDAKTGRIEFRHFAISLAPSGVSKGVKALVGSRAIPSLGDSLDVADFLTKSGYGSVRLLLWNCHCRVDCHVWAAVNICHGTLRSIAVIVVDGRQCPPDQRKHVG